MKKITFISMLMLFVAFSTGAYAADAFIAGFEPGETGYTINSGWYNGDFYTWEIASNSETSGINNSDNCLITTSTFVNDRWGYWIHITLNEPMIITADNRYFKMMVKRSPNTTNMALSLDQDPWGTNFYIGQSKPYKTGTWCDVVFDLFNDDPAKTCQNRQVQKFLICLGTWDAIEPGICMLDNIALSDNSKPRGAYEIQHGLLADFDNENLTVQNWSGFSVQSAEAFYKIDANPLKDEANPSNKCLMYSKPANTTWWHSLMCFPNGIIPVEYPNSNFHIMMYIPDAQPVTINISSSSGKTKTEKVYPLDGDSWYDYVVDVSELDYINQVAFRFNQEPEDNWNNPAGLYYVDDFVLNDDTNPRETIASGVKKPLVGNLNVYAKDGKAYIISPSLQSAAVYSVCGQLVGKQTALDSTASFDLPKGTYIIQVETIEGTVSTQKLIIF